MSPEAPPVLMSLRPGSLEVGSVQAGFGREASLLLMLYREEVFFFLNSFGCTSYLHHSGSLAVACGI